MIDEYRPQPFRLLGHTWIEHAHNPDDVQLWGRRGFFFKTKKKGRLGVWIVDHTLANTYIKGDYRYKAGEEALVYIWDTADFHRLAARLQVAPTPEEQIALKALYETEASLKNAPRRDVISTTCKGEKPLPATPVACTPEESAISHIKGAER